MALGSYRNSPFVTGQDSSTNGLKTEILNYGAQNWQQVADYPFSNRDRYVNRRNQRNLDNVINFRIAQYATASIDESVLIFSGRTGGSAYTSTIAEYKDGSWKKVGNLAQARMAHSAMTSGSVTMIVGGYPNTGST